MTKNRYDTPNHGDSDWHIPLNENFEALDRDVEIRDLNANRSDYEPKDGAKFVATDTYEVYLGDGSSWESIGAYSNPETPNGGYTVDGTIVEEFATPSLDRYNGDREYFDVVSSDLPGQDYMLEGSVDEDTTGFFGIIDPDPQVRLARGYTYSAHVNVKDTGNERAQAGLVLFANVDNEGEITDGYEVRMAAISNYVRIIKWEDGEIITHVTAKVDVTPGSWYRLEVDAELHRLVGRLLDETGTVLGEIAYVDAEKDPDRGGSGTPLTDSGIGWHMRSREGSEITTSFDLLQRRVLNQQRINSPDVTRIFVREDDPATEYEVYDDTDLWIDTSQ